MASTRHRKVRRPAYQRGVTEFRSGAHLLSLFVTLCFPTLTRRFSANQIPALCFRALLDEEVLEVELTLV